MNLPTLLTLFRIAMGPTIAGLILWASQVTFSDRTLAAQLYVASLFVFGLAAASDWLDGWLARKLGMVTRLGAALDHSADKVLITCVLVALAYADLPMPLVVAAIIILGRDVAVAGVREALGARGEALPVSSLGKWKAVVEMAGVGAFLAFQASVLYNSSADLVHSLNRAAQVLLWTAAALALVSGADYAAKLVSRGGRTQ
ncbi:MAG: CDP-diacylglycerol--glycerol-3-phosphate 3-phosphatidyltransferase [Terricaulis sp.]